MKGTIIIVIAVFVIIATAKTSEGKRCCCNSGSSKKPEREKKIEIIDENRNIVFPEAEKATEIKNIVLHGNSTPLTKYLHPVFMKRKICCLCKLPLCICKICKDSESWFLNPKLRAPKQEHEISSSKTVNVTGRKAKLKANSTAPRVPSLKEYNIQKSKIQNTKIKYKKGGFKLQCDCMRCKLCSTGKCGVILKCDCCGPLYRNVTSKEVNFSKLLFKMHNKLNVRTKFLEISQS